MRFKAVIIALLAIKLAGCSTYESGFEVTARGFSPQFVGNVASAVASVTPTPRCEGGVRVTDKQAAVRYRSDSNGLRGQALGAPGRNDQNLTPRQRRNLPLFQGEQTEVRVRQETWCQ